MRTFERSAMGANGTTRAFADGAKDERGRNSVAERPHALRHFPFPIPARHWVLDMASSTVWPGSFGSWRKGRLGGYARTFVLLAGLTALVVALASWAGGWQGAVVALVVMAAINLASFWFSDRIVLAMHRARPLAYEEAPHVHESVRKLAARAGIPVPKIVYVPDQAPNAFATGRNPEHAVVAVTQGALAILDPDELEGVIGHELSHVINRDMLVSSIAATLAGALTLIARLAGWGLALGTGRSRDEEGGTSPLVGLLLIIVAPIIAMMVQLAISRSREYAADATGARLVGNPRGLARALAKLDAVNHRVPMRSADMATAHLYIVEPHAAVGANIAHLFSTHPPTEERIRRLLALGKKMARGE